MSAKIRLLREVEWDEFMRFLERSYGYERDFFRRHYPHLYKACNCAQGFFRVLEVNGKIVSHVGLFPMTVVIGEVKLKVGGIGGVATLPEQRGKGHMERLIRRTIEAMRAERMPLSVLWGDRQRYGAFGWETAGEQLELQFSERSLSKAGVKSDGAIRQAAPGEGAVRAFGLRRMRCARVERSAGGMQAMFSRLGNRVWVGRRGYLCGALEQGGLTVFETAAPDGSEASLIRSAMEWCGVSQARTLVGSQDCALLGRLLSAASGWRSLPEGMFRVNDFPMLLKELAPVLERRAIQIGLGNFACVVGMRLGAKVSASRVSFQSGKFTVERSSLKRGAAPDRKEWVRAILGGPAVASNRMGIVSQLFPVGLHIPAFDQV